MRDISVFLVDDDTSVRRAVTRLLRIAGMPIRAFASAEEFLDEPVPSGPSCVIVDVWLSGMTGPELVRNLRELGREDAVIFLSGLDAADVRRKFPNEVVLTKPIDGEQLLRAIRMALAL